MSTNRLKKQEKRYENLDFAVQIKKDNLGILKHFIESEKEAHEHDFQGQFYPSYHYEINRVMSTKMTKIPDEIIHLAFYYRLKLGTLDKPLPQHFSLFLNAVEKNIADNNLDKSYLSAYKIYLLFGVMNSADAKNVHHITYEAYTNSLHFLAISNSYTSFPNLRKKHIRFLPFIENKTLMQRIYEGISSYFNSDFTTAGSLVLLLLDTQQASKDVLFALHKNKLENTTVWLLGSFYKDFQNTNINKQILKNLYDLYPKEWIDEYQPKKWS